MAEQGAPARAGEGVVGWSGDSAHEALRTSESRYRRLFETAQDGILILNADTAFIEDVNPYLIKMLGYSHEEFLGKKLWEVGPFADIAQSKEMFAELQTNGYVRYDDLPLKTKSGARIEVEFVSNSYDCDGIKVIQCNIRDIRQRKLMETELRAKEIRYEAVVASATDAIITSDDAGRIVGWNRSAERIFGYAESEIIGQPVIVLIPQRLQGRHLDGMKRVQAGGELLILRKAAEHVGRRKDASEFPLELSVAAWRNGESLYFTATIRDITQRKAAEAKIDRHTHLYAALSECNKAILHCATQEELFQRICAIAVQHGGMKTAWVRLVDNETHVARLVAKFGDIVARRNDLPISTDALSPSGQGPIATAIRENRPVWVQEIRHDPSNAPWQERSARAGIGALAALPIRCNGVVVGAFLLGSCEASVFDEAARDLLVEMAADVSFALDNFARESQRRHMEEDLRAAKEKYRGLVEQSIAGIFIMQGGKVIYANRRCAEIVGQGSTHELIGADLFQWVAEADRGKVVENMRQLLDGEARSVAMDFGALSRDGEMVQIGTHVARATHEGRPAIIGLLQDISEKKRAEEDIRRYVEQLKTAFMSTVEVATTLSEMRDPYTAGHERRVAEIAVAIGAELGFDVHRQEGLRVAGHLHDIGKITIPLDILSKPGRLSPIEFKLIQGHAQSSYDALKGVEFPWPVAEVALQHHERMDGSGYPQNLKGEAILLEARIMAVSDVVEAMSSHRPYRPGLGIEKALAEIERGSGTVYDPVVAGACLILFRQKGYQLPSYRHDS